MFAFLNHMYDSNMKAQEKAKVKLPTVSTKERVEQVSLTWLCQWCQWSGTVTGPFSATGLYTTPMEYIHTNEQAVADTARVTIHASPIVQEQLLNMWTIQQYSNCGENMD